MRRVGEEIVYSSQDLRDFVECKYAVELDVKDLDTRIKRAEDSRFGELMKQRGTEFEARYHEDLKARTSGKGLVVKEIDKRLSMGDQVRETLESMRSGVDLIYQARLDCKPWQGYPDYLRKVNVPSRFGDYGYEVVDVKLRSTPSDDNVLQVSLYSHLLGMIQGAIPEYMYLATGDGQEHRFKFSNFSHYFLSVISGFLEFAASTQDDTRQAQNLAPIPCSFCEFCKWRDHCDGLRKGSDHLSMVAGVTSQQARRLRAQQIETVEQLAAMQSRDIDGIGQEALEKIASNASLLLKKRQTGQPQFEIKQTPIGRGFYRLPLPSRGDLFLDLEGDPSHPDGRLEYLFGMWDAKTNGYIEFWGHDQDEEKIAFENTIDFITQRLIDEPDAYVYHYGHYEDTQLKRLCSQYSTREEEVDEILRKERLVDLLKVTREAVRTSEPGSGLKALETFFMPGGRTASVQKADDSVVLYAEWLQSGEQVLLDEIREYNREDCISTMQCRDWLIGLKRADIQPFTSEPFDPSEQKKATSSVQTLIEQLIADAPPGEVDVRELAGQLTMFHQRANRPAWFQYFSRSELSEEELIDSAECLGGLELLDIVPPGTGSRIPTHVYKYPEQEFKLQEGDRCVFAGLETGIIEPLTGAGEIMEIRRDERELSIKHPGKIATLQGLPDRISIAPSGPIRTDMLRKAVERYTASLVNNAGEYEAISGFLGKEDPVVLDHATGTALMDSQDETELFGMLERLNESVVFIQGPPGSGKTTLGGKMIVGLMEAGHKIGISSNSHRAINELLQKVEDHASEKDFDFKGEKKYTHPRDTQKFIGGPHISNVADAKNIDVDGCQLIAGTAWLFCNERFDRKLDYLFIDESGQVSLADLVALGVSARNIVLLGDQMQLAHPTPGTHPGESGKSTLDYFLSGQDTVPGHQGIFLGTSYRMHPSICEFISEAVYEGRLLADDANARQKLLGGPGSSQQFPETGIKFIEVEHDNCSQSSEDEAQMVLDLYEELLGCRYVDRDGVSHDMTPDDVMVVAPYNAQVNLIKEKLDKVGGVRDARVGTIDLFQGQEAQVVIVSMTTSNREELPRYFEFLFSRNRLNVALSRARCLDIVICSSDLLSIGCRTIEQMELVNTLCWARDYSRSEEETIGHVLHDGIACLECSAQNIPGANVCEVCGEEIFYARASGSSDSAGPCTTDTDGLISGETE